MASLPHPTSITTHSSTSINASLNNPFLFKTSQLSALKAHRALLRVTPKVSCQSCRNHRSDDFQTPSPSDAVIDLRKLDRRNMLIGLGGMYGAATTLGGGNPTALAEPALPNVVDCQLTTTSGGGPEGLECCPPKFKDLNNDFDIRNYPSPKKKVRRPAHLVADDPEYMAKFTEAIRRMKALPRSDPRNFIQQANVHCAYCDGAYKQIGYPNFDLLVHFSWLFFPFHRMYLFFFERILGKLIDDPNFALPYWNWDHPDGMRMPIIYTNPNSPLYDVLRDPYHQPPRVADLSYNNVDSNASEELQIRYNLIIMNFQMLRNDKPELFMGAPLLAGSPPNGETGAGAIENVPHNALHFWVGDRNDLPFGRDMGSFFSAARDPLFYGHHSNVDRMWYIWNKELGNPNFTTPDWLDTYFYFYDENGKAVRVYTRDCLDIDQLGYTYEKQDLPWLNLEIENIPKPRKPTQPPAQVTFPKTLDSVIRIRVPRPKSSRSKKEKQDAKEVLKISIRVDKEDDYIKFDVFVNDDQDFNDATTVVGRSYVGSFASVPHKTKTGGNMNMNRRIKLPLTEILEDLSADSDGYVDVAIVPKAGKGNLAIKNVTVEYLT